MNPSIQGYAAAVLGELDGAQVQSTASDLQRVEETILANSDLRAAMTDTSVSGNARKAVMAQVLENKVGGPASRLAAQAVLHKTCRKPWPTWPVARTTPPTKKPTQSPLFR